MEMKNQPYPLDIRGDLTLHPCRGLWLLKWLLCIPHYICLIGLTIAFCVVCIIAFFAILFTEKYPKSLFEFNAGVLRYSWRVGFYSYEALGTDKYPPFSLRPDPDYPAGLTILYPEKLSRWQVLIKWWLLAIPHYIVLAFLGRPIFWVGIAVFISRIHISNYFSIGSLGWRVISIYQWLFTGEFDLLIFFLTIFAGFSMLFSGKYAPSIFKLVIGFNRWVYRVAAYVFLMTDKYPPFRLEDD